MAWCTIGDVTARTSLVQRKMPTATRSNQRRTLWSTAAIVVLVNFVLGSLVDTAVLGEGVLRGLAAASPLLTFVVAAVLALPACTRLLSQGVFHGGVMVSLFAFLVGPFLLVPLLVAFGM